MSTDKKNNNNWVVGSLANGHFVVVFYSVCRRLYLVHIGLFCVVGVGLY